MEVFQDPRDLSKRILKNSFLAAGLTHTQGNTFLKTLRAVPFNLRYLPKDTRTLVNTLTAVASRYIQEIAGGEYLHIGLKKSMIKKLESLPENKLPEVIIIDLSTDGCKVDKGPDQYWPMQYRIFNIPDKRAIIVGIFKGKTKPSNPFDFFDQIVQEIVEIQEQGGIFIANRQLPLQVRCFIADAPARAFALNHYGHTASNACSKCRVEGHRCEVQGHEGAMIFLGIRHPLRTDEDYENLLDEDHHRGRSPLAPIVPLVTRVPFEAMHSVWIGNAKKVISAHVDGKFGHRRLNGRKIGIVNSDNSYSTLHPLFSKIFFRKIIMSTS
ncbi:uncharacterized protein LOC117182496 [Belonocnema kinseyi]|uniref:uncharacterized protein LOC117182496 n=1 Tax=Belonocnema kinseyi TaxID=2817044 RepID=UPI00143D5749|nr:uncharacterized protein LOC117182496 [Belonocnema kinseyi]